MIVWGWNSSMRGRGSFLDAQAREQSPPHHIMQWAGGAIPPPRSLEALHRQAAAAGDRMRRCGDKQAEQQKQQGDDRQHEVRAANSFH